MNFPLKFEKGGWTRIGAFILLLILVVGAFLRTYTSLQQTEFANGWDAYYYLIQIKAILTEGHMHSRDYSLIYPLLLCVKWFCSDYILAYKVTVSLVSGLFIVSLFIGAYQMAYGQKLLVGLLAASIGLFSPAALFVESQFLKNFLGMVLFIGFIASLPKGKWYVVIALFLLTFLTHRLTGMMASVLLVFHFANKKHWKWLLAGGMLAVTASLLVPGVLHLLDLGRFSGELQWIPQFAPWSFLHYYGFEKLHWSWYVDLSIACMGFIIAVFFGVKDFRKQPLKNLKLSLALICLLLCFPFFIFNAEGPALRLFFAFLLLAPLFTAFFAPRIPSWILILLMGVFSVSSLWSRRAYDPQQFDPPYALYDVVTRNALHYPVCYGRPLVIAHKALAEYFTFTTGKDALPWQADPEIPMDSIVRISADIERWEFKTYLDTGEFKQVVPLGLNYSLLPESLWQTFIRKVPPDDTCLMQRVRSWQNPWRVRPAFIQRNRPAEP